MERRESGVEIAARWSGVERRGGKSGVERSGDGEGEEWRGVESGVEWRGVGSGVELPKLDGILSSHRVHLTVGETAAVDAGCPAVTSYSQSCELLHSFHHVVALLVVPLVKKKGAVHRINPDGAPR